jgi:hypothetical protein
VTAGPMFRHFLQLRPGKTLERDGFVFVDLMMPDA